MNRSERRKMVKDTIKNGKLDPLYLLRNSTEITRILLSRLEEKLKKEKIDYRIDKDEVKSSDPRVQGIYERELEKLKNQLKDNYGDYKKIIDG